MSLMLFLLVHVIVHSLLGALCSRLGLGGNWSFLGLWSWNVNCSWSFSDWDIVVWIEVLVGWLFLDALELRVVKVTELLNLSHVLLGGIWSETRSKTHGSRFFFFSFEFLHIFVKSWSCLFYFTHSPFKRSLWLLFTFRSWFLWGLTQWFSPPRWINSWIKSFLLLFSL